MSVTSPTETVTAQEWQAKMAERSAAALAHFLGRTTADKLDWCPEFEGKGRSALEQARECAIVNRRFAAILQDQQPEPWPEGGHGYANLVEAQEDLIDSARELARVIRGLNVEQLHKIYSLGFGEFPGAILIELPVNNMNYHAGAINYIQVLYGDPEFTIPDGFKDFWSR